MEDYRQINTDIGFAQAGSLGRKRARLVSKTSSGLLFLASSDELALALIANSPAYYSYRNDFGVADTTWTETPKAATVGDVTFSNAYPGLASIVTDAAANDYVSYSYLLNFKPDNGGVLFQTKAALATNTANKTFFAGLNDALTEAAGVPFTTIATTPAAVATDAVTFGYTSTGTNFIALAVKNGTVQSVDTGVAPTADTYQTFSIYIDTSGNAVFSIDGVVVARIDNAVTDSVSLAPFYSLTTLTTAAQTARLDYIHVASGRV